MKYFNDVKSEQQAKKLYLRLSKKLHPDLNPKIDDTLFKEMNNEYLELLAKFRIVENIIADKDHIKVDFDKKEYIEYKHKKRTFDISEDERDVLIQSVSSLMGIVTNKLVKKFINKL